MAGIFFRPKRETFLIADFIFCLKPFTQSEIKKRYLLPAVPHRWNISKNDCGTTDDALGTGEPSKLTIRNVVFVCELP